MRAISLNTKRHFFDVIKKQILLFVLIALVIIASLVSDVFLTVDNLLNILRQVTIFGIISFGLTFVLLTGNIDLSVGSIVSLISVMFVDLQRYNPVLAVLACLVVGLAIGLFNGFIVGKLGVNSTISTLAMMILIQGLAMFYTKGYGIFVNFNSSLLFIGRGYVLHIPMPVIIFLFVLFISYILLQKTVLGKRIYATGGKEQVAILYGIKTSNIKMLVYVISGVCCVISAFILSARIGDARPEQGAIYLFDAITAVILGGTSLYGGKGGVINTLIGILIIGILGNFFVLIGIEYFYQLFFKGLILILAVWIDIRTRGENQ